MIGRAMRMSWISGGVAAACEKVGDQKAVEELDQLAVPADHPHGTQPGLSRRGPRTARRGANRTASSPKSTMPVCSLAAAQSAWDRGGRTARRLQARAQLVDLRAEPRVGEIVQDHWRRTDGHPEVRGGVPATGGEPMASPIRTTRAVGLSGVDSGRNHRNQIRPREWPAVEIQLGWPGSCGRPRPARTHRVRRPLDHRLG